MSRSGFVLPAGFMNDSGLIVLKAVERWRPTAEGLLIVHDDLDLALGEVRERDGGGHGGHNGLRDIIARLGTGAFRRLRIGIGRPPGSMDPADYVLATFRPTEREPIEPPIDRPPASSSASSKNQRAVDAEPAGLPARRRRPDGRAGAAVAAAVRALAADFVPDARRRASL